MVRSVVPDHDHVTRQQIMQLLGRPVLHHYDHLTPSRVLPHMTGPDLPGGHTGHDTDQFLCKLAQWKMRRVQHVF